MSADRAIQLNSYSGVSWLRSQVYGLEVRLGKSDRVGEIFGESLARAIAVLQGESMSQGR